MPVRTKLTPAAATSARPLRPPGVDPPGGGPFESTIGKSRDPSTSRAPVGATVTVLMSNRSISRRRPEESTPRLTQNLDEPAESQVESDEGGHVEPAEISERLEQALFEIRRVIAGQDQMLERVLVCLLAQGHLLIEGVPGLAKTLTI